MPLTNYVIQWHNIGTAEPRWEYKIQFFSDQVAIDYCTRLMERSWYLQINRISLLLFNLNRDQLVAEIKPGHLSSEVADVRPRPV